MQVFSCEYCENFKNTYFEKHLRTAAFDRTPSIMFAQKFVKILKRTIFMDTCEWEQPFFVSILNNNKCFRNKAVC